MQRIAPFKTLDIFRGLAAVWVVMDHSCDRWITDNHWAYLKVPLYAFSIRGQLGVFLFFLISGYCITGAAYSALVSGKSFTRYGYERIRRIYPPYLAALLAGVLSFTVINIANANHWIPYVNHTRSFQPTLGYWVSNLLLLQMALNTPMINVVFWSLCYEVAFYFIIGVFLVIAQEIASNRSFAAGAAFFANSIGISTALALIWLLIYHRPLFPLDLWHQFSIGGLVFFLLEWNPKTVDGYTRGLRLMLIANVGLTVVLTLLYAVLREVGDVDIGHPSSGVHSITGLIFAALLISIRPIDDKIVSSPILRPLLWVGTFSYSLYLIHPVVIPYVEILSRRAGLNENLYWINFWIQVAVAIFFGRIFYFLIESRFISKRQVQRFAAEHVA